MATYTSTIFSGNASGGYFGVLESAAFTWDYDKLTFQLKNITLKSLISAPSNYSWYVDMVLYKDGSSYITASGDVGSSSGDRTITMESNQKATIEYSRTKSEATHTFRLVIKLHTKNTTTGKLISLDSTYDKTYTLTVYTKEHWSVTYNANGGSGAPASQTKWYNENLALSGTRPTRPSYKFYHWNTNTSNTGTTYTPSYSYTNNSALTLYAIWNPEVTYDANGGTGAPSMQDKTYGVNLTLRTNVPTRLGYAFNGWNTAKDGSGTSYAAGGTYTGNTSITLYAKWVKTADNPTISALTVIRCDSSGTQNDMGTYFKVSATWKVDTVNASGNTGTVTGQYKPSTGPWSQAKTFSLTYASGSGSATSTAVVGAASGTDMIDTDTQYDVRVTVTDSGSRSSYRDAILTTSNFILDLKNGGRGIGIGAAAPRTGLKVGWASQFEDDMHLLQDMDVDGNLNVDGTFSNSRFVPRTYNSDIFEANSNWTLVSQEARVYDWVCSVNIALRPKTEQHAHTAYGYDALGTFKDAFRPAAVVQGFSNLYGMGYINGMSAYFCNLWKVSTGTSINIAVTYILNRRPT